MAGSSGRCRTRRRSCCSSAPLLRLGGLRADDALRKRVEECAERVGLAVELLTRFPHQLSGGRKARVGIARAIACRPRCEFAAQVMCADAGFHADQARRYIGETRFHLATRLLLPQHDGAARIVAHEVERVLADIDADHSDRGIGCLRHGVLLVFGACVYAYLLASTEDEALGQRGCRITSLAPVQVWALSPRRVSGCRESYQNSQAIFLFSSRGGDRTPYASRIRSGQAHGLMRATTGTGPYQQN